MKNSNLWKPSKFEFRRNAWRATKNLSELGIGGRFIASLQLKNYEAAIKSYARGKMIDLGCGKIPLYGLYKDYVDDVVCADWEGTFHKNDLTDLYFDLNNIFPIEDSQFDTVLSTDVLEHIANPDNFWKETSRITKEKGILILGVPFFHKLHEEPFDYFRYTEFRIRKFCEENNFEVKSLYPYGGSLEILIDFFANHLSWSNILSRINYTIGTIISRSPLGKKIYKVTSSKFPLGYILIAQKK